MSSHPKTRQIFLQKAIALLVVGIFCNTTSSISQAWSPYGAGFIYPNVVFDLIDYNGQLHAGGAITGSGSNLFGGIAKWDGVNWTTLGGGANSAVYSIVEFNGDLIAGGDFTSMGNIPGTKKIARWDGTSWHAMGAGLTFGGQIHCMAVYDGKLYIGGNFQQVDNMNIIDIAVWNGTSWSSPCTLSLGLTELRALEVFNNELYIGGYLGSVNGITCYNIAKFDGQSWGPVGDGLNSGIFSLYSDTSNNRLFAAGNFSATAWGGVLCPSNIACWDGNSWSAFGTTVAQLWPREIYMFKNEVYAGYLGFKINSSGDTLNAIARWDGVDWKPLGRGLRHDSTASSCHAMLSFNGGLAVGGGFKQAGNISATLIAEWDYTPVGISEFEMENDNIHIYPNPFRNTATVELPDAFSDSMPLVFELHNMNGGKVLERKVQSRTFEISREALPAGVYTYRLLNRKIEIASGKVMIE